MKAEVYDRLLERIIHYGNASTFALRKAAARMEHYSPRQAKAFLGEAYYDRGRLAGKRCLTVWQKGGTAARALEQQRKATARLFELCAGRQPTEKEMEKMGANQIAVG